MDYALFLYCNVTKNIEPIRKKYDDHKSFPAHITLCYLKSNIDELSLINKLKKIKKFEISLDKIDIQDDLISLKPNDTSSIDNIIKNIKEDILKLPKSGFHLSLVYKRGSKKIKKSIIKEVVPLINLPEVSKINKIWLLKRNKSIGKDWYRSKTIFLK